MLNALKLSNGLSVICKWAARLAGLLLFVLTAVIIYDVIGRRFFATGSFKLQELEWHLHGVIATFAFGYAYTRNAHVRIDILDKRLPARFKLWMEFAVIVLLLLPFLSLIVYHGVDFAWRAFERGEASNGGLGLTNRWIIKSAVPVSAMLAIAGATSVALRCLVVLRRPHQLGTPFEKEGLWKS